MTSLIDTRPKKQQQPAAKFQSVFRIKQNITANKKYDTTKHAQQTKFQLASSASSSSMTEEEHVFHSRRSHRKSRLGCGNCKKRRVKCDETKPECTRCVKYGVTCDFTSDDPSTSNSGLSSSDSDGTISSPEDLQMVWGSSSSSSPDMAVSSMSLVVIERSIAQIVGLDNTELGYGDRMYLLGIGDHSSQLTNLSVLHSFITRSTETIPDAKIKKVMKTDLIRTAFGNAHLMHTVLAASYLHMNHVRPGNKHRRVQETFHWQRAIQLYQGEMQEVVGPHNTDALLGSCILMGMNTLLPVGFKPRDSWVFTRDPADLNWLALQGGMRCLIEMTNPFIAGSIWGESFQESGDRLKPFQQEVAGRVDMHEALADLCEIDDSSTPATNPYHWHIQLLSRMLTLEPLDQPSNYNIVVTWMGQILPEFIALLRVNDERALLILSWWMALMCAMASYQVWIHTRIVPECKAICMYLEENSSNAEILRLVQWPAAACGYRDWTPEALERVTLTEET